MSTPYGLLLSFETFRAFLVEHFHCRCHRLLPIAAVTDVDGTPTPAAFCFERVVNHKAVQAIVVIWSETQFMTRTVLRSTCAALKIADPRPLEPYL